MNSRALLLLLIMSVFAGCTRPEVRTEGHRPALVVISIDGLHPDNYLDPTQESDAPVLHELARKGWAAAGILPIYPSVTFPSHASLATGVPAAKHGIMSNTFFDPVNGLTSNWAFDSRALRVPTLWDAAREAGLKTAVFAWPVSLNAKVDWLLPEIFSPYSTDPLENWKYVTAHTDPAFLSELTERTVEGPRGPLQHPVRNHDEYDAWVLESALHVVRTRHPDLTMLHFRSYDLNQHKWGRAGAETRATLRFIDSLVGRAVAALDPARTVLVVLGDHGFADVRREIRINTLFRNNGWLKTSGSKVASWEVLAQANGNQAFVYLRNPESPKNALRRAGVLKYLENSAHGRFKVLDRAELDALGGDPAALCGLDAAPGYFFSAKTEGPLIVELPAVRGEHGAGPGNPDLESGFMAYGKGILPANSLRRLRMIDVAPTLGRFLGIALPQAEGTPLNLTVSPSER